MNARCDQCELAFALCHQWITVQFETETIETYREFCRMECLAAWTSTMMEEDE